MKEYILNYYSNFKCVAERCKHTCCAGWEMCIDEQSLLAYKNENSSFAKTLHSGINFKKFKFKADKSGRCAFLNDKGLCEIIINLGEKSLCQVCRDHPRFRSFFSDRVEMGLGFCCEEAARIILSFSQKIQPILVGDGNDEPLGFIEKSVLDFRVKALEIVQDRKVLIDDRIKNLLGLCRANVGEMDYQKIINAFIAFERLDESWTERLSTIKSKPFSVTTDQKLSLYCEQFLVNSIYRHASSAEDTMWVRARTIACVFSWWIINNIIGNQADFNEIIEVVRAYSAEVEYSQNNLNDLFDLAYEYINL